MDVAGKTILVVGLGKSGVAAAKLLSARGARVIGNDVRSVDALPAAAELEASGVELSLGSHDAELFTSVDAIVLSPGVPPLPALDAADAASVPVLSEVELASRFVESTLIAITGTNGKSTVTTLVGDMCSRTGHPTFVGGNLGTPLVEVVDSDAAEPGGYVVVEVSSFQLERVDRLAPDVAVLLNVTDDHLDRYDAFADYAAAKGRIFHAQRTDQAAVVPAGDALCESLARAGAARLHRFGDGGVVRLHDGAIVNGVSSLRVPLSELSLRGAHNYDNACAAALTARLAGVEAEHVAAALRAFSGLPHRMQLVATSGGVEFIDDSKATNVGAASAALDGLPDGVRAVLIAGGKDKGGSYAPLAKRLQTRGRAVVLIGEAAPTIRASLAELSIPILDAPDMPSAVVAARGLAEPGDVVLLAPACSSFDMFESYAHRGDVFAEAVREVVS